MGVCLVDMNGQDFKREQYYILWNSFTYVLIYSIYIQKSGRYVYCIRYLPTLEIALEVGQRLVHQTP